MRAWHNPILVRNRIDMLLAPRIVCNSDHFFDDDFSFRSLDRYVHNILGVRWIDIAEESLSGAAYPADHGIKVTVPFVVDEELGTFVHLASIHLYDWFHILNYLYRFRITNSSFI